MLTETRLSHPYAQTPRTPTQTAVIATEGLHCHECVERMVAVLRGMDGVVAATAELARERLTVRFDPSRVDVTTLYERIELSGYRPCAAEAD
jgi:Cu+-exporting ATPase